MKTLNDVLVGIQQKTYDIQKLAVWREFNKGKKVTTKVGSGKIKGGIYSTLGVKNCDKKVVAIIIPTSKWKEWLPQTM